MTVPELSDRTARHDQQIRDLLEILIDRLAGGDETPDRLASLTAAAGLGNLVVVAEYIGCRIPVGPTSASLASLLAAVGRTLPDNLQHLFIAVESEFSGVTLRVNHGGAASAVTGDVPGGALSLPITQSIAAAITLYAASTIYVRVLAFVPRS